MCDNNGPISWCVMADYDDKTQGPVFPTRTGVAQGAATERVMLDVVNGASGIRTRIQTNPDGSQTMLRTRAGFPEFTTLPTVEKTTELMYPKGLTAYPQNKALGRTWSAPCIIELVDGKWVTKTYNPLQTKAPTPPEIKNITPTYWTGSSGNTCLSTGEQVFWAYPSGGSVYSEVSVKKADPQSIMPFLSNRQRYMFIQEPTHTKLVSYNGDVVFEHYGEVYYEGFGLKPFNIQLPPAVSSDGMRLSIQSAVDFNWQTKTFGSYNVFPDKHYRVSTVVFDDQGVAIVSSTTHTLTPLGFFDGVANTVELEDDNSGDTGTCYGLSIKVRNGLATAQASFNPPVTIPWHADCVLTPFSETVMTGKGRSYLKRTYALKKSSSTVIGNVPRQSSLAQLYVGITADYDKAFQVEGKKAYGVSTRYPAGIDLLYSGEVNKNQIKVDLFNIANDKASVVVSDGQGFDLILFEHTASLSSAATKNVSSVVTEYSGMPGSTPGIYVEGYPTDLKYLLSGVEGDGAVIDNGFGVDGAIVGGTFFPNEGGGAECAAFIMSHPVLYEAFGLGAANFGTGPQTIENITPFSGTVSTKGVSRTILGLDLDLGFCATLVIEVTAETKFSAEGWDVGGARLGLPATTKVKAYVEVKFNSQSHRVELFAVEFVKPGPWDIQEISNWRNWPFTPGVDSGVMHLVGTPLIFPDSDKCVGVDAALYHQGVNPCFAGISGLGWVIFAKRFSINSLGAQRILNTYKVSEGNRAEILDSAPFYYCPELAEEMEKIRQIEFDSTGLRAWVADIKGVNGESISDKIDRDAICYRV